MTQPKQPPPGVETTPQGPVVSLQEAAARLSKDPRTRDPRDHGRRTPRRRDAPTGAAALVRLRRPAAARAGPAAAPPTADAVVEDLRAQIVSLTEANRLLIAAQQDLLDADQTSHDAAEKYRAAARNYLDALAQFMTPGHLGDLADL